MEIQLNANLSRPVLSIPSHLLIYSYSMFGSEFSPHQFFLREVVSIHIQPDSLTLYLQFVHACSCKLISSDEVDRSANKSRLPLGKGNSTRERDMCVW